MSLLDTFLKNPTKDLDTRWHQQIHQICGGELVVIRRLDELCIRCKKCTAVWNFTMELPPDWDSYKPVKVDGLWLPGEK